MKDIDHSDALVLELLSKGGLRTMPPLITAALHALLASKMCELKGGMWKITKRGKQALRQYMEKAH